MNLITQLSNYSNTTLSIYFPFRQDYVEGKERGKNQQTKLKGFVEGALREHPTLQDHKDFRLGLVQEIEKIGGSLNFEYEGIAIFFGFNPETETLELNEYRHLPFIPEQKIVVGSGFYLTPLLQNQNQPKVISIELSRYAARLSQYAQEEFEVLEFIENQHVVMDEVIKEEMKQYQSGYGWWNTGEDTDWIDEEEKRFLKDLREKIQNLNPNVLVLFISTNFQKIQPSLEKVMGDLASRVHVIPKESDGQWSVKEELLRISRETKEEELQTKSKDLQKNRPNYETEIEAIIKGLYTGQFDYLLLSSDFDFESLAKHQELIAKYAQKEEVEHPWTELERTALKLNTAIHLLDSEQYGANNLLAGHKRFEMEE